MTREIYAVAQRLSGGTAGRNGGQIEDRKRDHPPSWARYAFAATACWLSGAAAITPSIRPPLEVEIHQPVYSPLVDRTGFGERRNQRYDAA